MLRMVGTRVNAEFNVKDSLLLGQQGTGFFENIYLRVVNIEVLHTV